MAPGYPWKAKTTSRVSVNSSVKSMSLIPTGSSFGRARLVRLTTLTTRNFNSGSLRRRISAAATTSIVTTSPAQPRITSTSPPGPSLEHQSQIP